MTKFDLTLANILTSFSAFDFSFSLNFDNFTFFKAYIFPSAYLLTFKTVE